MADHFFILSQFVAAKVESTPGTAEVISQNDVKIRPFADIQYSPEPNRFVNEEISTDLGQAPEFISGKRATISFGANLKCSGELGTAPAIAPFLRGMGLQEELVETIDIDAPTGGDGEFAEGETYTGSGGKAGFFEQSSTGGTLRYVATTGGSLESGDTVTAPDGDQVTVVGGDPGTYGVRYRPTSSAQDTVTVMRMLRNSNKTFGKDQLMRVKGAMGTASIDFQAHDILRIRSEFQGVHDSAGLGNMALFPDPAYEDIPNEDIGKFINATLQLGGVTLVPNTMSFSLGSSVEMDPDPTSSGGGTAGYDRARVTGREPTITLDPRRIPQDIFDDLGHVFSGTTFPFHFESNGTAGNKIEILAPECQIRGWGEGNRVQIQTANLTIHPVRRSPTDTDYSIYFR